MVRLSIEEARRLAERALAGVGASAAVAASLSDATVAAELAGRSSVGFAHLLDYLAGIAAGRIRGDAEPRIDFPAAAMIRIDAGGGIAQLGFDRALDELAGRADAYGIALLSQSNSYSAGELGYYTRRLAERGLVAFAATNGNALLAAGNSRRAVYGTNPLSFAAPMADGPPLVIDQASSWTAFVNVRRANEVGEPLPPGWAIDRDGQPTTDASAALQGALLAFGGERGANIALMVEILAAGVSGANWSIDAPPFDAGSETPGSGLLVVALTPDVLAPDFGKRLAQHAQRLLSEGIHIPGRRPRATSIELSPDLLDAVERHGKA